MSLTISVSPAYGWVILAAGIGNFVTNMYLGGTVMKARSSCKVPYPNAYAVPGYHEKADEFNRAQRSHQNFMELNDSVIAMALTGGISFPYVAAGGTMIYYIGGILYQIGYIDTSLAVESARYKKGGILKWVGVLTVMGSCAGTAYKMITSSSA